MRTRFYRCLLTALVLIAAMPCRAAAVSTSATAAILVDADSGRVLYEQNADTRMRIASTTKILTALVALRDGCLSDIVTVSSSAAGTEGSSMYLQAGEQLTLETLLYGLLLSSGNDAAAAIADHLGGQREFVRRMNALAQELGMTDSSFANPSGLDDKQHYSTARDMAKLARAAMNSAALMRIASTKNAAVGGRTMTNHNKLLSYMPDCVGLKTGYTKAAGRTLVTCAERGGQRLAAVTLQDGNDWADHQALYDYGFSNYPLRRAAVLGETVGRISVAGGVLPFTPLTAASGFAWPVAAGETLTTRLEVPVLLQAPVSAGTVVGQAVFLLNGAEVGRIDLLCGRTVLPKLQTALSVLKWNLSE